MNEFKAFLTKLDKPKSIAAGIDGKPYKSVTGIFKMFGMEEQGERGGGDLFKFNFDSERNSDFYDELVAIASKPETEQKDLIIEWNKVGFVKFTHKTVKWKPYWNHNVLSVDKGDLKKGQAEIIKFGPNHPTMADMPQVGERITAIKLTRSLEDLDAMIDAKKRQIERLGMVITESQAEEWLQKDNVKAGTLEVMKRVVEDQRQKASAPAEEVVVEKP